MTGEITLRGRIMPIGGLKEKLLAAHRMDIDTVSYPQSRIEKDLKDIPSQVMQSVRLVFVSHMDQVLREALSGPGLENDAMQEMFSKTPRPAEYVHGKLFDSWWRRYRRPERRNDPSGETTRSSSQPTRQ